MASTVYYGTSITGENVPQKVVKIKQADFNPNNLQPGDILSVYFAHRNSATNPTLIYTIGDSNEEISISGQGGDLIYNTSQRNALSGAWTDGEVVNFSYTADSDITQGLNNTTYWEMVAKGVATDETYGVVKIDDGDESAISVGAAKDMIESLTAPTIIYHSTIPAEDEIGYIQVTYHEIDGTDEEVKTYVYIPHIPNDTGDLEFNSAGYLTNLITTDVTFNGADSDGSKKIKIDDGNGAITIIDLDNYNNGVDIYSQENINLLPTGQVVIGTQGSNKNLTVYGNIYANNLDTSGITVDTIGAHTNNGIITFTSPTNLEDDIVMNGGIYVGEQTLEEYIESLFESNENKNVINNEVSDLLEDYLLVRRYYYGPVTNITNYTMVTFGEGAQYYYNVQTNGNTTRVNKTDSLNISGYDIVGIIAWETWMLSDNNGRSANPQNANICSIAWKNNDPSTGVLVLRVAALTNQNTSVVNSTGISVDILYKKPLEHINLPSGPSIIPGPGGNTRE